MATGGSVVAGPWVVLEREGLGVVPFALEFLASGLAVVDVDASEEVDDDDGSRARFSALFSDRPPDVDPREGAAGGERAEEGSFLLPRCWVPRRRILLASDRMISRSVPDG